MRKSYLALAVVGLLLATFAVAEAAMTHLYGQITDINYSAKTLVVAGTTVYTTDSTVILICEEPATFDQLVIGQTVRVTGSVIDGNFVAKKICGKCLTSLTK